MVSFLNFHFRKISYWFSCFNIAFLSVIYVKKLPQFGIFSSCFPWSCVCSSSWVYEDSQSLLQSCLLCRYFFIMFILFIISDTIPNITMFKSNTHYVIHQVYWYYSKWHFFLGRGDLQSSQYLRIRGEFSIIIVAHWFWHFNKM